MAESGPPSLRIEARDARALFDETARSVTPHVGPLLDRGLAFNLESQARFRRSAPSLQMEVTLHCPALAPAEEERLAQALHRYFAEETEAAELDLRVNRVEGGGSLRFGVPFIVVALAIAGFFYFGFPEIPTGTLLSLFTTLFYLVFITIVWVMLWDPVELLLFNGYLLRRRRDALRKLADAPVRFRYSTVPDGA